MRIVMDLSRLQNHRNLICSTCLPDPFGLVSASNTSLFFALSSVSEITAAQTGQHRANFLFMHLAAWMVLAPRAVLNLAISVLRKSGACQEDICVSRRKSPFMDSVSAFSMRLLNGPVFSDCFFC